MDEHLILEIQNLSVDYTIKGNSFPVLRNINLCIEQGQIYGLVGESGSGKSTLGLTIMCHLPPEGRVKSGKISLFSRDLMSLSRKELQRMWGKEISFVPQDPYTSLNPSMLIGKQLAEGFQAHFGISRKTANERSGDWLRRVRLSNPEIVARKYPHELSGGQKQRILAAMALINHPRLLVLDEPTTSLDVTSEVVVLELLRNLIREENTSALFITHNFGIVKNLTDRVAVLYAGELVEDAPTINLTINPIHPYSQGLIKSIPRVGMRKDKHTLVDIPGRVPSLNELPKGCVFAPRCQLAIDICREERPPLESYNHDSKIRCFRWQEIQAGTIRINTENKPVPLRSQKETRQLLSVKNLEVKYQVRYSGLHSLIGQKKTFNAVNGVSFQLDSGKTLGIVGESGSGKTSIALALMGLIDSTSGQIYLLDKIIPNDLSKRDKETFRKIQIVFQNQDDSFSPNLTVEEILIRPLQNLLGMDRKNALECVKDLLELVHIPANYLRKYPRQLSGGEKQRIALAQSFGVNPEVMITDEPVSSLDVSVQARILNLLLEIQRKYHSSNLLISHNIAIVSYLADVVLVMYLGQVMQYGTTNRILSPPYHPYTELLLSSYSENNLNGTSQTISVEGNPPDLSVLSVGCPFSFRCQHSLGKLCEEKKPPMQKTPGGGLIFCHIPITKLQSDQVDLFQGIG